MTKTKKGKDAPWKKKAEVNESSATVSKGQKIYDINGDTLRHYRDLPPDNITQYALAHEAKLSRSFIADIEQNRKSVRYHAAHSIVDALNHFGRKVTIDDLLEPIE